VVIIQCIIPGRERAERGTAIMVHKNIIKNFVTMIVSSDRITAIKLS
jgi:hypothetical protein